MGDGLRIAFDAAAATRGRKLTPAQKTALETIRDNPGELRPETNPNTLSACFMKGWIRSDEENPDPLKKAPWTITRAGLAMLNRENS